MILGVNHKYIQTYLSQSRYEVIEPYSESDDELIEANATDSNSSRGKTKV